MPRPSLKCSPYVDRIVIANPKQVHMIAHAKVKTDTIDATALAKLYASGFLPEVWVPDPGTLALRRQVTRRTQLVRQRSRLKNLIQSILHAHLIPPCPHGNLVGISGRKWLTRQILPADERTAIERHDAFGDRRIGGLWHMRGPRGTVDRAGPTFGLIALDPARHDLGRHAIDARRMGLGKTALYHGQRHLLSTQRR